MISRATKNKAKDSYFLTVSLAATNADPLAVGVAKFEKNVHYRRFKIIITNTFLGGDHQVKINGRTVGTIGADHYGCGELGLDTRENDGVPMMEKTDIVEVRNSINNLILIGSFDLMENSFD